MTYRGQTLFADGFGVRRAGGTAPVDQDTVFQLASLSKPIGATVVARQVTLGKADWSMPVAARLPGFALKDPWVTSHLTVGDLYSHRSGLPDHAGDDLEEIGYDRAQVLARLRYLPLDPFRITYNYTNFGIQAAADAVAAAAGTPWETLAARDLYQPLGMTSTSSRFADYIARPNRAYPHVLVDGAYRSAFQRQPDAQSAAGGVSSSVRDLSRWMTMVLDGGAWQGRPFLSPSALTAAVTPHMLMNPPASAGARPSSYGYGFITGVQPTGRTMLAHSARSGSGRARRSPCSRPSSSGSSC